MRGKDNVARSEGAQRGFSDRTEESNGTVEISLSAPMFAFVWPHVGQKVVVSTWTLIMYLWTTAAYPVHAAGVDSSSYAV